MDMDGSGTTDFTIRLTWLSWNEGDDFRYRVRFESETGGAYVASDGRSVDALHEDVPIGPSSLFSSCGEDGGSILWYVSDDDDSNFGGKWGGPGSVDSMFSGFIGVRTSRFSGGYDHFGWIHLTVAWITVSGHNEPQLVVTVHDWARDIEAMAPIEAGEKPSYRDWTGYSFAEDVPAMDRLPDADPDGDGLENYSEYVFFRNPMVSDNDQPVLELVYNSDGQPAISFTRRIDDPTLAVVVEVSDDLSSWRRPADGDLGKFVCSRSGNVRESIRASCLSAAHADGQFYRLKVVDLMEWP